MAKETGKRIKKMGMLPTLREKRHYLLIKVESSGPEKEIKKEIDNSILRFLGILGYAKAGPKIIAVTSKNNNSYIILSILTKYVDSAKASIALIKEFQCRCIGVSGTIKKLREKFFK
ncbi:hypothetical protein COS75_00180 [Candidatus Pacearchaeota archaeon CG06_land_8_20_14_3_00_35_12]|nr:MAG: hypothetical protein COS75_00180 [Candidatus Pacearchaeota archaeon CG06_land_8_20_14_3_00_35_12]